MKIMSLILFSTLLMLSQSALANRLVNDMQGCQGYMDFIDAKLAKAPAKYSEADVKNVLKGLDAYDSFIQTTIVTPGLLKFTGGDKAKADALQQQVNEYKKNLVTNLHKRYPQPRLFMDHAVSINDCAKKAVPTGQALEDLKLALNTIVKLAQLN